MKLLIVSVVCLLVLTTINGSHINRSKDHHKIYHSKSLKWTPLEPSEKGVDKIGGVNIGRVSLTRGESYRRRSHKKESLSESDVREFFHPWINFKTQYNKSYENLDEERERFSIFARNKRIINDHNKHYEAGNKSFKLEVNHLADLRPEEYNYMNGFKRNYGDSMALNHGARYLPPHHTTVPDSVDWRQHNYVTDVKNQGHCGSCWSFSSTGALEGQHKRMKGTLISLSEQNLVDCSTPYGNHGCNGGLMDQAFQYIKENGGIDTELSYPYEAMDDHCRYKNASVGAHDKGFVDIPSGSEQMLRNAVATVGPVSVAIDASHQSFQFYNGGVYFEPRCSSEALDHGVLVVGYGITDEGVEYWIVKNSWGSGWGQDGYIKMARDRDNMCGIATQASYPLV